MTLSDKNLADGQSNCSYADSSSQGPAWLHATCSDLDGLDFEAPISGSRTADSLELSRLFLAAAYSEDTTDASTGTPARRVYVTLGALTGMLFKPAERDEPFGAMFIAIDGRRTAIPSDFHGELVDFLAKMATQAKNPVLRSRLADVCWLLRRNRVDLGMLAIAAYIELVQEIDHGQLTSQRGKFDGPIPHAGREYLLRALQIGRAIDKRKDVTTDAIRIAASLRKRAIAARSLEPVHWFSKLDLDFNVSNPAEVACGIGWVLSSAGDGKDSPFVVELWRIAARAYHSAKNEEQKNRCNSEAAECLVLRAESAKAKSPLLASHWLCAAIAQLHGIPGKKDRRSELRRQLLDIQSCVSEEMSVRSYTLDLCELVERVEQSLTSAGLLEKLFLFISLDKSPKPDDLERNAIQAVTDYPLSSYFGTTRLDRDGKVVFRTEGAGPHDSESDSIIQAQIARHEAIRRQITAGTIEAARATILNQHFITSDILAIILQHSVFVPPELLGTFCQGFLRFFQGDLVSGIYILTPLLESALRHVLKIKGHDVTVFDDATQTQKDRTISQIFEQMRRELDEVFSKAVVADIESVFLSKLGPRLRHTLSHGLLHDSSPFGADAIYGCWLIFRLCLVPLIPYREQMEILFE